MINPKVILVDEKDNVLGEADKLEVHEKGLLHRAVSVLIYNSKGEWLLQKRANGKYHSSNLWTNTCCSHPYPGELSLKAAERRLMEEMGMECALNKVFDFCYFADLDNQLSENELDHVFAGVTDSLPILNPEEASEYRYISTENLLLEMKNQPSLFTEWFKIIVPRIIENNELIEVKLDL